MGGVERSAGPYLVALVTAAGKKAWHRSKFPSSCLTLLENWLAALSE